MTDREVMQMALDALQEFRGDYGWKSKQEKTWEALRAALAQGEQEPVAWMRSDKGHIDFYKHPDYTPLYTAPPQRPWQGLTDEDLEVCDEDGAILARYWEAKLKEKNT